MITLKDYLMGRGEGISGDLLLNAKETVTRVNLLLSEFGVDRKVTSGYRTPEANAAAGGAKKSNHMLCKACDLEDKDGKLDAWCEANQDILASIGLWLESPKATPTWCHLQIVPPRSGNRIFTP